MTIEHLFVIMGIGVTLLALWQLYKGWTTGVVINPLHPSLLKNSRTETPKAFWVSMSYYVVMVVVAVSAALLYGQG
jgi:hypothetical protein